MAIKTEIILFVLGSRSDADFLIGMYAYSFVRSQGLGSAGRQNKSKGDDEKHLFHLIIFVFSIL